MWRERPRVARTIVGAFLGGLVVVAVLRFWSDETWGLRYIVWVAWQLPVTSTYAPYEGPEQRVALESEGLEGYGLERPTLWLVQPELRERRLGAVPLVLAGAFCLVLLRRTWRASRTPPRTRPVPAG